MDPRCYFSGTWWRKAKQISIDALKQRVRLKLLKNRAGAPLMDAALLVGHHEALLRKLRTAAARVLVLGLLPVSEQCFPGTPEHFRTVNAKLRAAAEAEGADFFDWGCVLGQRGQHADFFYRDGFHPNAVGARALAEILQTQLS
jgi:lysophospholipase L1-like esterase